MTSQRPAPPRWARRLVSLVEWGLVVMVGLAVLLWLTVLPLLGVVWILGRL